MSGAERIHVSEGEYIERDAAAVEDLPLPDGLEADKGSPTSPG